MKYLKKFKLFENDIFDLNDVIYDENEIESYFKNNWTPDEEIYNYLGSNLFNYINDDEYLENEKSYMVNNYEIDEYPSYFSRFIQKTYKHEKYIDLDFIYGFESSYIYPNPDKENEKQTIILKDFIVNNGDENTFMGFVWDEIYGDMTIEDYLKNLGYSSDDYYDTLKYYVDHEELDKDLIEDESFDVKQEYYLDNNDLEKIVEYDNKNIVYLFNDYYMSDIYSITKYQMMYVTQSEILLIDKQSAIKNIIEYIDKDITDEFKYKYKREIKLYYSKKTASEFNI